MALEAIKNPGGAPDAGLFNVPPNFPIERFAVEWVEEGMRIFKEQRQYIPDSGMSADGWTVYKGVERDEDNNITGLSIKGKPITVTTAKNKTFVLMVRPKQIQVEVNALCGNVSKKRIRREVSGETVAGNAPIDTGILTEQQLKASHEGGSFENEVGDTQMNTLGREPSAVQST